ncbi:hypothetical protein EYF80_055132 [Liparis tanakae]|uniref:Uncharacterized protein n=1 Tax=Liparis tanakae TaxID=230148 RepID=A0A4Z2F0P0_9TELE|nr:hypothetical protein EYF80_055132 [Liparis tanakae]
MDPKRHAALEKHKDSGEGAKGLERSGGTPEVLWVWWGPRGLERSGGAPEVLWVWSGPRGLERSGGAPEVWWVWWGPRGLVGLVVFVDSASAPRTAAQITTVTSRLQYRPKEFSTPAFPFCVTDSSIAHRVRESLAAREELGKTVKEQLHCGAAAWRGGRHADSNHAPHTQSTLMHRGTRANQIEPDHSRMNQIKAE